MFYINFISNNDTILLASIKMRKYVGDDLYITQIVF